MPAPPVFPGQTIAGKYRVERLLGEGGHAFVLAAQHLALGDKVAIKVLKPEFAADREFVGRFLREARAAVRIKGDHVTRILDVGSMEDGAPYMVMEHLLGHDLRQILHARSRLAASQAVDFILQTCEALAEAHGIGIVHRDVKPENLFLTHRADGSPWIKVLDFGISKAMPNAAGNETAPNFTQTQSVVGSPQYMAPEQMSDPKLIDPRTDIWGLGVTLYELLTGAPPFTAATLPQMFAKILRDRAPAINRSDVPPGLESVIACCLEKDLEGRFATVADLARALAPFSQTSSPDIADRINRVGVIAYQSGSRLPTTTSHDVMQAFDPPPSARLPRGGRNLRTAALAGALFSVVTVVGVVVGLRFGRSEEAIAGTSVDDTPPASGSTALAAPLPEPPTTGLVLPAVSGSASSTPPPPVPISKRPVASPTHIEPKPAPTKPATTASSRYD